jgi:PAS domain S-box-containing protein
VKEVIARNQTGAPRRQIILRPLGSDGDGLPQAPAAVAGQDGQDGSRDELTRMRAALDQWTDAEKEWHHQRQLFQAMSDNVSDLVVLLDPQGHRTWNNAAYTKVLGYAPEEVVGTHALSEVHPDDKAHATEALNKTMSDGSTQQCEYRVHPKSGEWLHLRTESVALHNAKGDIDSILLLAVDRTENKRLTESLAQAKSASSSAGAFDGMVRDFGQIIANVAGDLTTVKDLSGAGNAIAPHLLEMERSLQRARDLLGEMSAVSAGQASPKVHIALEPTVHEIVSSLLRGTFIRTEFVFPRNLPEVEVDQEAFAHVIRNIVTNSMQAMDKGVIRISAENMPERQLSFRPNLPLHMGNYVCLHIQDQGHGISEKAMPRIFEPYFTTRSGAQGLGLSTALSSVQKMGGTIHIDSTPGVGTSVSLYFPVATDQSVAPTMTTRLDPIGVRNPTRPLPKATVKRRILLMDDEQMILDIVSRMLGHLGYEVATCTDGSQAIAAFAKAKSQNEPYEVVMMDLIIPNGVGGQDAVHTIKKIDPNARVIASSGHLEHPVMLDHKKFGFNAVLEKPYKLEKLQQVIEGVASAPA